MGQLEKYGLYVLCLVIFLILGVAIWGGDPAGAQPMGNQVVTQQPGEQGQGGVGLRTDVPTPIDKIIGQLASEEPTRKPSPVAQPPLNPGPDEPVSEDTTKPGPVGPQPGVDRKIYTIAKGDNFSRIAEKLYSNDWIYLLLQKVNPGVDSSRLDIGQQIRLPSDSELQAFLAKGSASAAPAGGTRLYTVRRGDSFWKIAANELGDGTRHQEIADLNNNVTSGDLDIGQVIRIPAR